MRVDWKVEAQAGIAKGEFDITLKWSQPFAITTCATLAAVILVVGK
jgi:hypothetical protein